MYCKKILLIITTILMSQIISASTCTGHFVNPIKDVCWRCLFPLTIGNSEVIGGILPDTTEKSKDKNPIGTCRTPLGIRVGLKIGYWEPTALVDVTDTPYCLVNLGGHRIPLGKESSRGGRSVSTPEEAGAFFHVHWYRYPLIAWLNLITSAGCQQGGDFDVAYLSELDPTWKDSQMQFVFNPEAALFGNPIASSACAADSLSSTFQNKPLDSMFWCAGSQGNYYPLSGHVSAPLSPVQTAMLLTERMNYKLHRFPPLIADSSAESPCEERHLPVLPKSRYRYEMVNQVADGKHCYPSGHTTLDWEMNKIKPHTPSQYGFLVWRKRNCVFL